MALETLPDQETISRLKTLELRTKKRVDSGLLGSYRSAFRGTGLTFTDLRQYQPSDNVKDIHWKVTARTGKVFVKTYEEDRMLNVILAVDISRSTAFGSTMSRYRRAIEFAALIAMLAWQSGDALGLCLFSDQVEEFYPAKRNRHQFQRIMLSLLDNRDLHGSTNLGRALEYIRIHQSRGSVIFFISDFLSGSFDDQLRALGYKHDLICVFPEDPVADELPRSGIIQIVDAESRETVCLDSSSRRVRKEVRLLHQSRLEGLQRSCLAANCDLVHLGESPIRALSDFMKRRIARYR